MNRPTIPILAKNILIVDDNAEIRETIVRALEIEGYTVLQAEDGQAALSKMSSLTPDLIISDINMPNLDGFEFYKAVHQNPLWTAIPFIFLTSNNSPTAINAGRELGAEAYLLKPVDLAVLAKVVNARLLRAAELQIAHIDQAYLETVNVLANTIEGRDPYTHGHVQRVANYARWLAEALNWPPEHLRMLEFGARLHDIGKIIVPDQILNKPGPLSRPEWELMRQHTEAGARILRNINHLRVAIPYVLHHHERWDGSGYPQGLKDREIPLEGRLLALADVYDALTTHRPYHPARPHREVLQFLSVKAGSLFDPDLTEIFIQVLIKRAQLPTERIQR